MESEVKLPFCGCGYCGLRVIKLGHRFIHGHNGRVFSLETRKKISKFRTGTHHSEETRKKMSAARTGTHPTAETRKKMSVAHTGTYLSEETKKKIGAAFIGKPRPDLVGDGSPCKRPEVRRKMSIARMGRKNHMYGKHHTEEVRKKISVANSENHPNWRGGFSLCLWHPNFTEVFREKIRDRDNSTCQICDKIEEVSGRSLSVHHIHYDGETNDCSNDDDFITLCVSCHVKTNYDRDYWEKYFMLRKLNEIIYSTLQ